LLLALATALGAAHASSGCSSAPPVSHSATPEPLASLEAEPPPIISPDKRLDASSSSVVFDRERGGVWTANGDVGSISYVDANARKVVRETPIGRDIRSIALSPDFKWIAAVDRAGASVTLVDADTGAVVRTVPLGTHPRAAVWDSADPRWLYVAVEDDDAIALVDRSAGVLTTNIPVGRLPSGVAVSRQRREVYVTHRIDARVSIVDLATRALTLDVPLSDEPPDPDPKTPQGKSFAFESLAWAPDGNVAWLPQELLAPTHPFSFQETLFPSIDVVDLSARAEVQTDPNDPNGVIAGRKNLFDAINILSPTGNPDVLSQPCAAVLHPAGLVGYALACASEDLMVFDLTSGIAIDLLRNLPGDHPVGLALDATGQRLFVISDQSHTLLTLDTAGGNPVQRTTIYGDPISLVAKDPLDSQTRAGLELFFRANSSKGALATTSNNWISCAGCHLDGFVSTNKFFFEALHPENPKADARIGHGTAKDPLKDLFSTVPTPNDSIFNPHDILRALLDQGGLNPDRTGNQQVDLVNASSPPPSAVQMAKQLALVIAGNLPLEPSWLLDTSTGLNAAYDAQWCGQSQCHQAEYQAWSESVHAHSADDPMMQYCAGVEVKLVGAQMSRQCAGCHDPVSARMGDSTLTKKRGITCLGCHDVTRTIRAGGNGDLEAINHDWTTDHKAWATASLVTLRDPRFCGGCHEQFVPGNGLLPAFSTLTEWQNSSYAANLNAPTGCIECHMPTNSDAIADHRAAGGNLYMGTRIAQDLVSAETAHLKGFASLTATKAGTSVTADVFNFGSGHGFPTGVSDIREAWVEVQALDGNGKLLSRIGGPGTDGLLPKAAARLGAEVATSDGTVLLRHELSEATRLPFDMRVMPQQHLSVTVDLPSSLPSGTSELDAVLFYRNVLTVFYRAALGDPTALPPETELARAKIP
jgi:predicted CXXCH cytochrome family protein